MRIHVCVLLLVLTISSACRAEMGVPQASAGSAPREIRFGLGLPDVLCILDSVLAESSDDVIASVPYKPASAVEMFMSRLPSVSLFRQILLWSGI